MIEFKLKNRRLRLHPDGVIYCREHWGGHETKKEKWREIKFSKTFKGYDQCKITVDGIERRFYKHRLVKLAHDPTFDIFDSSPSNCIDHENHIRDDNSIDNLRVVTNQQNQFNRSGVKGYYWDKSRKKWVAYIMLDGKNINLGGFETEEEARNAYLVAKAKYHVIVAPLSPCLFAPTD
jgi:hypothetical protein